MSWVNILLAIQMVISGQQASPSTDGDGPVVTVEGRIVNHSTGEPVEQTLETMLHILAADGRDAGMLHGESDPDGRFTFEEVPFENGSSVLAMATYEGVVYQSEHALLPSEGAPPPLEIPVFDTTTSSDGLTVATMHLMLTGQPSRLYVTELYIIANTGNLTVATAPGSGEGAGLRFSLPDGASNVAFPEQDPERFEILEAAFLDKASVVPGNPSSATIVQYDLPYEPGFTLQHDLPLDVKRINLLIPTSLGIRPTGAGIEPLGTRNFPEQGLYDLYALPSLASDQPLSLQLEGDIATQPDASPGGAAAPDDSEANLAIGIAGFGLSLVGVGAWWLFRIRRQVDMAEAAATEERLSESADQG
jgi:hypothetical protein